MVPDKGPLRWGLQASWGRGPSLQPAVEAWVVILSAGRERVSREYKMFQAGGALSGVNGLVPQIDVFLSLETGEEKR